jgi:hypothetical protein
MANNTVDVNSVYQKVLALANKEQRGYITPQEFNYFADQAQYYIFENYFYDLKTARLKPTNDTEASDEIEILNEKISVHKRIASVFKGTTNIYEVDNAELRFISGNPLSSPTATRPVYERVGPNKIKIHPTTTYSADANIKCDFIEKPASPNWGYVVINGKALYNSNQSTDFDLHESEENNLVMKILELAGITLKDSELYQNAVVQNANTKAEKNN